VLVYLPAQPHRGMFAGNEDSLTSQLLVASLHRASSLLNPLWESSNAENPTAWGEFSISRLASRTLTHGNGNFAS
jgi:hypothetical protein